MKGQGLPLNTIVLAAIAILVLLLVVGFTTGALGKLFIGMGRQIAGVDISTARSKCQEYCSTLVSMYPMGMSSGAFRKSQFCKETFPIDLNKNGKIDSNEYVHCWEDPINVGCDNLYISDLNLYATLGNIEEGYLCESQP